MNVYGRSNVRICSELNTTVAQIRHFIKHLLHDFTKHVENISTILQFQSTILRNFLHDSYNSSSYDFTYFLNVVYRSSPRFYNFLHDITYFLHDFDNFLHDFTIFSTILTT